MPRGEDAKSVTAVWAFSSTLKIIKKKGNIMTVLKIERLPHNKFLPEYKTEGAAGMDLCAAISYYFTTFGKKINSDRFEN